jgi:GTP-binding protein
MVLGGTVEGGLAAILFFCVLQIMIVDEAEIYVRAGKGGDGCVSFRREKYIPKGGPDGGDGGDGGNVYAVATPGIDTLLDFTGRHHWIAGNGLPGMGKNCSGRKGKSLTLELPAGTLIYDRDSGVLIKDLSTLGERVCIAEAGNGGRGNTRFARPNHQTPREAEPGTPGRERWLKLELKLIADVGIVGLPNAGKSTLLGRLSRARPKVADYPFTTLRPHLGIVELSNHRRFVMADIPGLIEGAHEGAGLGDAFLKHIERTRVILHVVDAGCLESSVAPAAAYNMIRNELQKYSPHLANKREVVVANKIDLTEGVDNAREFAEAIEQDALPISAVTGKGIPEMLERLWAIVGETKGEQEAAEPSSTLPQPEGN